MKVKAKTKAAILNADTLYLENSCNIEDCKEKEERNRNCGVGKIKIGIEPVAQTPAQAKNEIIEAKNG